MFIEENNALYRPKLIPARSAKASLASCRRQKRPAKGRIASRTVATLAWDVIIFRASRLLSQSLQASKTAGQLAPRKSVRSLCSLAKTASLFLGFWQSAALHSLRLGLASQPDLKHLTPPTPRRHRGEPKKKKKSASIEFKRLPVTPKIPRKDLYFETFLRTYERVSVVLISGIYAPPNSGAPILLKL